MQLATSLTEEMPAEAQLHEDGITVHSWRVFREEYLDRKTRRKPCPFQSVVRRVSPWLEPKTC